MDRRGGGQPKLWATGGSLMDLSVQKKEKKESKEWGLEEPDLRAMQRKASLAANKQCLGK